MAKPAKKQKSAKTPKSAPPKAAAPVKKAPPKKKPAKAPVKAPAKKKGKAPARPPKTPASRLPSFTKAKHAGWPTMAQAVGTRVPLPSPRKLPEEQMIAVLAETQSKLGANIELDYGMSIVRKKRDGVEIIVKITKNGFEMEVDEKLAKAARLESPVQYFGSLSSAAMWVEQRMVSGTQYFNIAKNSCTEIRSPRGKVIDKRGSLPA